MVEVHKQSAALATLAVQERKTSRYLLFNDHLQLCGRRLVKEEKTEIVRPSQNMSELAFAGIHVISPRIFPLLTEEGIFSIIPAYLRLAAQGEKIQAFRADEYYWRDLGKPENIQQAEQDIKAKCLMSVSKLSAASQYPRNVGWIGQRIAKFLPSGKAALQRTHARNAKFLKLLCHTGTSGFIGSSTVENDLLVFRQRVRASCNLSGQHADGPRQSPLDRQLNPADGADQGSQFSRPNPASGAPLPA